jgi:hypothetical protein
MNEALSFIPYTIPTKKACKLQTRKRTLAEPNQTCAVIYDFQLPELGKNKFLLFKPLSFWHLVTAAQADSYLKFGNIVLK